MSTVYVNEIVASDTHEGTKITFHSDQNRNRMMYLWAGMKLFFLYIDPGSGSYIIQAIIAAILGSLFFINNAWLQIKMFFTGKKKQEEKENDL